MDHKPSLPVEILFDIFEYLKPPTAIIGNNATWTGHQTLRSWWDTANSAAKEVDEQQNTPLPEDSATPPTKHPSNGDHQYTDLLALRQANREFDEICRSNGDRQYTDLLALRQANREFDEICRSFLYHDFNLVNELLCDQTIASEIIQRYHGYIRTVRISVEQSWTMKDIWKLLTPRLSEYVTSLGVYYLGRAESEAEYHCNDAVMSALNSGRIRSFGIYSASSFSIFLRREPPRGATALLESIVQTEHTMTRFTSLDIGLDSINTATYDAIRGQLGNLRSLTIRGALDRMLGRMWEIEQRAKWFPSGNLTKLQLIHCQCAYAPHIPYVARLFPALTTLFIAGCGNTDDIIPLKREKGWSVREDAPWGRRAPLDSIRLECMAAWEVTALGAIHTENLIITALDGGTIAGAFEDKEIYPHLKLLRTELQYKELPLVPSEDAGEDDQKPNLGSVPTLEQVCRERAVVIKYDVEALMFPR